MLKTFYTKTLIPVPISDSDKYNKKLKPYYFIVKASSRRFVSPIIDRELKTLGYSSKNKTETQIRTIDFDKDKVNWDDIKDLYPKHKEEDLLK